jgi:hypothetical protein
MVCPFVAQSIEISNSFIRDYERVMEFAKRLSNRKYKSPSQEGDLGGG